VRGGQLRAGWKLGVRARGGRGKHGGDRGVRGKRIGSTDPRDTGSGGEGSTEEGEGLDRGQGAARVRFRGAVPDTEARPAGRNTGEGIGHWKEEERGGADMWARAGSEGKGRGGAARSWAVRGREMGQRGPCGKGRGERESWAGPRLWAGFLPSSFPFSFLPSHQFKQI
jgi:hypothetical protein